MQLNQGKFLQNGGCGYVLRPEFMFDEAWDPYNKATLPHDLSPVICTIRVLGGRHLSKSGRGVVSPFVEVEVVGADYDSGSKFVTKTVGTYFLSLI